ncbi:hypothetical protein Xcel_0515 [Xylanimonas cellulosilytica DSM 15894]|uniref:Uncharacterized protein n=1 Tax=Xylanimonas cellulosilytica (strain DSM 15894 / JCM 12276 / CECT 5975 / KCTC 9989 / LMG 20990 / NBRC 107835 / XIL07) TaxID=446471 RepID=D1BW51_XYLCX|nr:hypothetical protein Xcel_0515 [Xylanimonas cellulosilytica DSM 15894]
MPATEGAALHECVECGAEYRSSAAAEQCAVWDLETATFD